MTSTFFSEKHVVFIATTWTHVLTKFLVQLTEQQSSLSRAIWPLKDTKEIDNYPQSVFSGGKHVLGLHVKKFAIVGLYS